jgi:TonB family protein
MCHEIPLRLRTLVALYFLVVVPFASFAQTPAPKDAGQEPCKVPAQRVKPTTHDNVDLSKKKRNPIVRFLIAKDGSVSQVSLRRSSGNKEIDKAVVEAAKAYVFDPLPPGCVAVIEVTNTIMLESR